MNQFTSEIELLNESHEALTHNDFVKFLKKSGYAILEIVSYACSIGFIAAFVWVTKNMGNFQSDVFKIREIIMGDGTPHLEMEKVMLLDNYEKLYYGLIIAMVLLVILTLLMGGSFRSARHRVTAMSHVDEKVVAVKTSLENKSYTSENPIRT